MTPASSRRSGPRFSDLGEEPFLCVPEVPATLPAPASSPSCEPLRPGLYRHSGLGEPALAGRGQHRPGTVVERAPVVLQLLVVRAPGVDGRAWGSRCGDWLASMVSSLMVPPNGRCTRWPLTILDQSHAHRGRSVDESSLSSRGGRGALVEALIRGAPDVFGVHSSRRDHQLCRIQWPCSSSTGSESCPLRR
jgi:hypothetical protein